MKTAFNSSSGTTIPFGYLFREFYNLFFSWSSMFPSQGLPRHIIRRVTRRNIKAECIADSELVSDERGDELCLMCMFYAADGAHFIQHFKRR